MDMDKTIKMFAVIPQNDRSFKTIIMRHYADYMLKLIRAYAPKSTGKYAASWRIEQATADKVVISSPENKLHMILEYTGAAAGTREPRKAIALRWLNIRGEPVFRKFVKNWPGFKKIPHIKYAKRDFYLHHLEIAYAELDKLSPSFLKPIADQYKQKSRSVRTSAVSTTRRKAKIKKPVKLRKINRTVNKKGGRKKIRSKFVLNKNIIGA